MRVADKQLVMPAKATGKESSISSQRPRLVLEIPLDRLPRGTRFQLDAKSLIELLEARATPVEVVIAPGRLSDDEPAERHFLSPEELSDLGHGEVTVSEAAEMLGITRQAVLLAVKREALKARRVGSVYLVDLASVRAYRPRRRSQVTPSSAGKKPGGGRQSRQ